MSPLVDALTRLLNVLRNDWHKPGIANAVDRTVRENPEKTPAEIAQAALNLARDLNIRSPDVLTMAGRHWRDTNVPAPAKTGGRTIPDIAQVLAESRAEPVSESRRAELIAAARAVVSDPLGTGAGQVSP